MARTARPTRATNSTRVLRSQEIPAATKKLAYVCNCKNDAGCQLRRCTEPLAWNLDQGKAIAQTNCPLFTVIPKEIRDLIYEYALTESISRDLSQTNRRRNAIPEQQPDRAENLLLACKAIYLETFLLPLILNPVTFPHFGGFSRPVPRVRLPWQFANIQALDITLPQVSLEGDDLHDFLFSPVGWQFGARHRGVYVAPYVGLKDTTGGSCRSGDFTLLPASSAENILPLGAALEQMRLPPGFRMPQSAMRLQRARPLVLLTLRMTHTDWWTWTDSPDSTDAKHHHLGLDPALGDGTVGTLQRPTSTRMQELAQQRRDGYDPVSRNLLARTTPGWAHVIAKLPDIKTLEMVLETFQEKKAQLDTVVECAKTWRFPIAGSQFELAWDGYVEETRWSKPLVESWETQRAEWYARKTEFEVRTVRFKRRRRAYDPDDEGCKAH